MTSDVSADLELTPLTGEGRPVREWTTTFHLAVVALDPFTLESSWILETALRVLRHYQEADVRVAFLLTCSAAEARQFMGPLVDEFLVFTDADRSVVRGLGFESLPGIAHLDQYGSVESIASGWQPEQWRMVTDNLSARMDWSELLVPDAGDPSPFAGTSI